MKKAAGGIVVVAAGIVGWLYWGQDREEAFVVSGFVEADEVRVGSRVGGRVAEVLVEEGSSVKKGQVLFRIDEFDWKEQLAEAEAALAARQAELDRLKAGYRKEEVEQSRARRDAMAALLRKLEAGPRLQEIEIAREQVKVGEANLAFAESEHARLAGLAKGAQASPVEMDAAVRALATARAEVESARQALKLLEEGTRKEEVAQAAAALAEADAAARMMEAGFRVEEAARAEAQAQAASARVDAARTRLEELVVKSPCECLVEAIDLQPGDIVSANGPAVALLEVNHLWVRAYVPESRLGEFGLGWEVPVRVDSYPRELFRGRVAFIAREAEFTPRNVQTPEERSKQVFRMKVRIEEGVERLRVGMEADVLLGEARKP